MRRARAALGGHLFGIGMQEIALICVIALIVVGPKKLPEIARALGKGYGEFRRAFDDMKRNVETDFQAEEIRRSLIDLPPPAVVPPLPKESLLPQSPAAPAGADPLPYPGMTADAAPAPPPAAAPAPAERVHG